MDNTNIEQQRSKETGKINVLELPMSFLIFFIGIYLLLTNIKYYGAEILYIFAGCYILTLISAVRVTSVFVKLLKQRAVKKYHVFYVIIMLVIVAAWSIVVSFYAKDIFGGTKTITTEYYYPTEKTIHIFDEFDETEGGTLWLHCSKKNSAPVLEKYSYDDSEKMKISDYMSAYKCSPKIRIEYYPNTKIIKEIKVIE